MPAPAITYLQLKELSPCEDSLRRVAKLMGGAKNWGSRKVTAAAAREAGATFNDIIWVASAAARTNKDVERRLRLWTADCAARVLHIYEASEASGAPRAAIIAGRAFARGDIDDAAWAAARDAAWAAWAAAGGAAGDAAGDAAWAAWAAWAAARAAARDAAWAAWAAAGADAGAAEAEWQYTRLIDWLSDDEPQDWPLPASDQKEAA